MTPGGEAEAAEKRAIRAERPEFNIAGAVRPAESGRRREVAEKTCTAWLIATVFLLAATVIAKTVVPANSAAAIGAHVLVWVSGAALLIGFLPLAGMYLLLVTPQAYRFGCWLNLHFGDEGRASPVTSTSRRADVSDTGATSYAHHLHGVLTWRTKVVQ